MHAVTGKIRIIVAVLLIAAALGFYFYSERIGQAPDAPVVEPEPVAPRYPVPEPVEEPPPLTPEIDPDEPVDQGSKPAESDPLPEPRLSLAESDPVIREALIDIVGADAVETLVAGDRIIERVMVTVVSLDAEAVPLRRRPLAHVPGLPRISGDDDAGPVLTGAPDPRYEPYRALLEQADVAELADLYIRHYPLFQEAYEELGHPDAYFNDRLVDVIDHLLATPLPEYPVELTRPEVLYEYADEDLEAMSWGRKILIRIGPEHAGAVKARLEELRELVTEL